MFLEQEEDKDILKTLSNLPQDHSDLIKGYRVKLVAGNTLDNDDEHIGYMDKSPREIVVASPWNYGREFTLLHEIGHRVYETLDNKSRQDWAKIVKQVKSNEQNKELNQSDEELFCMIYAQHFTATKLKKFDFPRLLDFIQRICVRN